MKKSILILFIFLVSICSCVNSNKDSKPSSQNSSTTKDTLYNENIQGVFYDTPFGASKKEVINNFKKHGFYVLTSISTDALLHFSPNQGSRFTFGNITWEMLDVNIYNGRFCSIRFMNSSDDKATVIKQYDGILSALSKKYNMMEETPTDTTVYKISTGYSKIKRIVSVSCFRYETVSKKIMQGVTLDYSDVSFKNEVSDEL